MGEFPGDLTVARIRRAIDVNATVLGGTRSGPSFRDFLRSPSLHGHFSGGFSMLRPAPAIDRVS